MSELDQDSLLDIGYTARTETQPGGSDDTITTAEHALTSDLDTVHGRDGIDSFSASGRIDRAGDVDMYRVYVQAGELIEPFALAGNSAADPAIRIFDVAGNQLALDDSGASADPFSAVKRRFAFQAPRTDYYFVAISAHGNADYKPYIADSGTGPSGFRYDMGIYAEWFKPTVA